MSKGEKCCVITWQHTRCPNSGVCEWHQRAHCVCVCVHRWSVWWRPGIRHRALSCVRCWLSATLLYAGWTGDHNITNCVRDRKGQNIRSLANTSRNKHYCHCWTVLNKTVRKWLISKPITRSLEIIVNITDPAFIISAAALCFLHRVTRIKFSTLIMSIHMQWWCRLITLPKRAASKKYILPTHIIFKLLYIFIYTVLTWYIVSIQVNMLMINKTRQTPQPGVILWWWGGGGAKGNRGRFL